MTEATSELIAEREMDRLDKRYLSGQITEEEYGRQVKDIDRRARERVTMKS